MLGSPKTTSLTPNLHRINIMFLAATTHKRDLNKDEGGHWYTPSGSPSHTVKALNGTDRNTTKRDARKLGLYPSVTTISKIIANPSLDRWKQTQILDACLAQPMRAGESEEDYRGRVMQLSQKKMTDARAFGSLYHAAIDELNQTGYVGSEYEEIREHVALYVQWVRDNHARFIDTEFVAVNKKLGYAGTVDALAVIDGRTTLLDYKTQDVKSGKPRFYPSWIYQLAAYKYADWENKPKRISQVMSVVLPSNKPTYPIIKIWDAAEIRNAWQTFQAACKLWQLTNNFNPAVNAERVTADA